MNDRLFRVTVILSVLALVGMAGVGAVSAQSVNVDDAGSPEDLPITGTQTTGNQTQVTTGIQVSVPNVDEEREYTLSAIPQPVPQPVFADYSGAEVSSVTKGSNVTAVDLNAPPANGAPPDPDASVNVTVADNSSSFTIESATVGNINTAGVSPSTGADHAVTVIDSQGDTSSGRTDTFAYFDDDRNPIFGDITDEQGFEIENVEDVRLDITEIGNTGGTVLVDNVSVGSFNDSNFNSRSDVRSSVGDAEFIPYDDPRNRQYTINLPHFGPGTQFEIEADLPGFNSSAGDTEELDAGDNDRQDIQLERIISAGEIDVTQTAETVPADNRTQIGFSIDVFDDFNGDPFGPAQVEVEIDATQDNTSVFVDPTDPDQPEFSGSSGSGPDAVLDTGSAGNLSLNVVSSEIQEVDFIFTAASNDSVTETRTKTFGVVAGEGQVPGQVFDESTTEGLPDATTYAVTSERYRSNTIAVTTPVSFPSNNDTAFFRVKKDTDGDGFAFNDTIIDHDRYEVEVGPSLEVNSDGEVETEDFDIVGGPTPPTPVSPITAPARDVDTPSLPPTQFASTDNLAAFLGTFGEPLDEDFNDIIAPWERTEQVGKVNTLDLNDSDAGQGFFAVDRAPRDDTVSFMVTPLEPGNYTIERSVRQANATRRPSPGGGVDEPFENVTRTSPVVSPGFRSIEVRENLTSDRARADSDSDGPRLIDDTDEDGDYLLSKLFTDGQAGVYYTLIAEKSGYDRDFGDVFVQEDGFRFEDESDEVLTLTPKEVDPEVNVTNLAVLPDIGTAESIARNADPTDPDAYSPFFFRDESGNVNLTDRFPQRVPRDGNTIDVLQVETTAEDGGDPLNETIELSVPDRGDDPGTETDDENFTGQFVEVANPDGTTVSQDPVNATITINTGPDGQAILWLQSDLSGEDLGVFDTNRANLNTDQLCAVRADGGRELLPIFSGVIAQSPTDRGVVDATCKAFTGTIVLQTAELSGVTSNQDNDPVEATVFTEEIDLEDAGVTNPTPGFTFNPTLGDTDPRIEVNRTGADQYTIRHVVDNVSLTTGNVQNVRTLGSETGLTRSDLRRYEGFETSLFPELAIAGEGRNGFTLLTESSDVASPARERATYTLPDVPAETPEDEINTGIVPTGFDAQLNFGTAVETGVQINRTSTANIEITSQIDFQVTSLNAPSSVNQSETFDVAATIENQGGTTAQRTIRYELRNTTTNNAVASASNTTTIVLAGGENTTVTFPVDTTGINPGNYTNVVDTQDDEESAFTNIASPGQANFQLSNLDPEEATVTEGDDPIDVAVDVDNVGGSSGTQDLELTVENETGDVVYSDTISGVSVDAGDNTTETFTDVPAGTLAPGEYNHIVSSDDDTIEGNLTVQEDANFDVSNVEAPDTEKPANATITAQIENTGETEGTQDISFLLEGEDTTVGGGALDIVFTFDSTGSMFEEISGAQDSITEFTDEVDASGADARYSLVEFKNENTSVSIEQDLTSNASAVKSAIDSLSAGGGGESPEASYEAIRSAVEDTDRRSSARLVVIHITDAPAHYDGDGFGTTDLTRSDAASALNGADARFICACPAGEDLFSPDAEANVTDMAINDVDDSLFVRLASGDFGDTLTDEIATAVTEAAGGVELNLDAGESDTVTFEVPTEDLSTGLYDVTVNSEDDSDSTTTNITEAAVGELTFNDQALASDGTVTVEDVSTGQPSTVVVTYTDGSEEVIAGINGSADNLDNEDVSVLIEDAGGFPGEHTAWVFDDGDVPAGVGIGDDATPIAGAALDSDTAFVSEASPSPIEDVSDELWTAVTSQDDDEGNLSLSDVGDSINAYQSNPGDAEIDGVPISLGELGDIISYYQDVVAA